MTQNETYAKRAGVAPGTVINFAARRIFELLDARSHTILW